MKNKSKQTLEELKSSLKEAAMRIGARQEKNTNLAKNLRREIARKETEKNG